MGKQLISDDDDEPTSTDLGPVPRPGFRSSPHASSPSVATPRIAPQSTPVISTAHVVAGAVRAVVGVICFAVALLYLPTTMATPVLAGVSLLMMTSGTYSLWRELREFPQKRTLVKVLIVAVVVAVVVPVVGVVVFGAGAFSPLARKTTTSDAGVIQFKTP